MKNIKKISLRSLIAVILVFSVLFATSCADSGNENVTTPDESTTNNNVNNSVTVPADTTQNTQSQEADIEKTTEPLSQPVETQTASTSTQTQTQVQDQETTADDVPDTIKEIVTLFNGSANKIKTDATKIVKNYEKRIVDEENLVVPASLESTAKNLISTFMKDDTDPIVYETREDITNEFLVPKQSYVSKLKAEDVTSATCVDNGTQYIVNIKVRDEKNPKAGAGVGSVFDVIEANEVSEKVSFIEDFSTNYYSCELSATIDKATGKITHINYTTPLVLDVTVNLFGTHSGSVGLTFEKDYTITY